MGKFDLGFSFSFLILFYALLPLSIGLKSITDSIFTPVTSFLILHSVLIIFLTDFKSKLWFILTVLHGLAHIYHPAFIGTTYNTNYTPIYDFAVHSAECLCIYYYSKRLLPIGIFVHSIVFIGAALAHLDNKFMAEYTWIFVSGCGVFGVLWHMMLLNTEKNSKIFWTGVFLWFSPYLGYLDFSFIPYWDSVVNSVSLFSMWFFNWQITIELFNVYCMKSRIAVIE